MNRGRDIYNNMLQPDRDNVDQAFHVLYNCLANQGYRLMGDDRAERLVDAICVYIEDSKLVKDFDMTGRRIR